MKKGKSKKEKRKFSKKAFIILAIIILLVAAFIIIIKFGEPKISGNPENKVNNNIEGQVKSDNSEKPIEIPSLNSEQKNILNQTISSSEFVKDIPEKGVIALRFYDFNGDTRIWRKDILVGRNGFLSEGTPDVVLIMHSKYISQLTNSNLCDIIKSAQTNGEMWVETQESTAKLFLKYAEMMKYKDCFGF